MTDDPRGSWSSCPDCGRLVRCDRYGVTEAHPADPSGAVDPCPGSGRACG